MKETIGDQLSIIADQVGQIEGGKVISRQLFALAASIDAALERQRLGIYRRGQELYVKLNEFHNETVQHIWEDVRAKQAADHKRIARLLAASEQWSGTYQDAITLIEGSHE